MFCPWRVLQPASYVRQSAFHNDENEATEAESDEKRAVRARRRRNDLHHRGILRNNSPYTSYRYEFCRYQMPCHPDVEISDSPLRSKVQCRRKRMASKNGQHRPSLLPALLLTYCLLVKSCPSLQFMLPQPDV